MHQDQVTVLPSSDTTKVLGESNEVHDWACAKRTPVQGVYIRERISASQGHLGFDEKQVKRQIEDRANSGGIKDSREVEKAKETTNLKHDGLGRFCGPLTVRSGRYKIRG